MVSPKPNQVLPDIPDLLVVAAGLSFILGDMRNGIIISLVVLLNATIGFIQEFKAEKILKALNQALKFIGIDEAEREYSG